VESYCSLVTGVGGGGDAIRSVSCCVVVQKIVNADSAGVMFTANPFNQDREEMVVTSNFGLGESVVADRVTPDTYIVTRKGPPFEVKNIDIAEKKRMVVMDESVNSAGRRRSISDTLRRKNAASGGGGSREVPIPEDMQMSPSLTGKMLQYVCALGAQVEDHYQSPQDIEWAVEKGKVFLLQARPITTLDGADDEGGDDDDGSVPPTLNEFDTPHVDGDWITYCNSGEMFPGVGTPLTISTFGKAIDVAMQNVLVEFGAQKGRDLKKPHVVWSHNCFFFNLTNVLQLSCKLPGGKDVKENGEMNVLGYVNEKCTLAELEAKHGRSNFFTKIYIVINYIRTMIGAPRRMALARKRVKAATVQIGDKGKDWGTSSGLTSWEIWTKIDELLEGYNETWSDHVIISAANSMWMIFVMKTLSGSPDKDWTPEVMASIANVLADCTNDTDGADGTNDVVESADAVQALDLLKEAILRVPEDDRKFFLNASPEDALQWLSHGSGQDSDVAQRFKNLLERHGHRCVKESEFRIKDWGMDPTPLVSILQSSLSAVADGSVPAPESSLPEVVETLDELLKTHKHLNFITRPLARWAIRNARAAVRNREECKSLSIKYHSLLKRAYYKLAQAMLEEGLLLNNDADLLFFLTHSEIGEMCSFAKAGGTSAEMRTGAEATACTRLRKRAVQRRRLEAEAVTLNFDSLYKGMPLPIKKTELTSGESVLKGTPVSRGVSQGVARVVRTLEDANKLKAGDILICPFTDVGWTPYFSLASGLVTEMGGLLSHGAVVAREYKLPCIVNMTGACSRVKDGSIVRIDGSTGELVVVG
jgi:pyruvate,water dikinase